MNRPFGSREDLEQARQALAGQAPAEVTLRVCSTGCRAAGALEVCDALEQEIADRALQSRVRVVRTGCHGLCAGAVAMVIDPQGLFYVGVTPEDAPEIIERTVLGGAVIERLCWTDGEHVVPLQAEVPFYRHQRRFVLRGCGVVDPTSLDSALAHGAYGAAAKVLTESTPEQVIAEVLASGLRGRGGAGFPTGRKWQFARSSPGEHKYVICNADEGDPGAFMDRALIEGDPHLVLEGMIIGAYAIGADHGVLYVRAEYPVAIEHLALALSQAREAGLLGKNLLGSGFDFDLEMRQGAGAFVCGEETALIASVEGKRGMPEPRPPFPTTAGLNGLPTVINNVETWANVPRILEAGAAAYAAVGTEGSKGTKIFALAGKVNNTGLVEVPMGSTLRQLVYDIGGGIPRGRKFVAAQMGGPSGGCVPARYLDLPIDYDSVQQIGAIMGSGGLIVMDEATCMVDIARFFTDFVQQESCGKCVPCRVGTKRMLEILTRITQGHGQLSDLEQLERLAAMIKQSSLCGLGQTAPNPVLSTLRYFRDQYEAHIVSRQCPAHSCEALVSASCSSACPAHVNVPEYIALIGEGRFAEALEVIRRRNPLASICGRVCDHPCETFCRRGEVDQPLAIRHLKRFASDHATDADEPPRWLGSRRGRVAVVGSGPAGLSAAYFLALRGREVKIFEALDVLGGVAAVGIPEYRLPREVLARDIEYIRRAGVEMETGHRIESLQELREAGYDAIFVGVGAHRSLPLGVPGEDKEGVIDSLAFLRGVSLGQVEHMEGRVAVIGGGNAALDAARTALRLGAESVTILYRRTREEMPAIDEEVESGLAERIAIQFLVAPLAIEGEDHVTGVRCQEMELGEADESGRRRPVPQPGAELLVPADHVIVAIGQQPELDFAVTDDQLVISFSRLAADAVTQRSGEGDVFAGGDAQTGAATVIEAVAAGQRAAHAIDVFLGGTGELPPDSGFAPRSRREAAGGGVPREPIYVRSLAECASPFAEQVEGYCAEAACAEARRCLRCDLECHA